MVSCVKSGDCSQTAPAGHRNFTKERRRDVCAVRMNIACQLEHSVDVEVTPVFPGTGGPTSRTGTIPQRSFSSTSRSQRARGEQRGFRGRSRYAGKSVTFGPVRPSSSRCPSTGPSSRLSGRLTRCRRGLGPKFPAVADRAETCITMTLMHPTGQSSPFIVRLQALESVEDLLANLRDPAPRPSGRRARDEVSKLPARGRR
jgi:hypothetical protein